MTNKLNYDRSQMYVGFQRNGNGSHTMGNMFVDVLKEYKPYVVVIYIQRHCTFFIRLPWQFICKHAVKFNQTNEGFFKKLFCLCRYDVFPLTIIVVIAYWFDFNVELLLLPIITIAVIALVLKFYDKRKFSKKNTNRLLCVKYCNSCHNGILGIPWLQ